jgi:hypothetical protein
MRTRRTVANIMKGAILPLLFIFTASAFGQEIQPDSVVVDSLEVAVAEEDHMYKGDTADFVYFVLPSELEYIPGDDDPSLMADRLACIERSMPLIYNERVHAFINYFTVKDREYTRMMMRRKNLVWFARRVEILVNHRVRIEPSRHFESASGGSLAVHVSDWAVLRASQ